MSPVPAAISPSNNFLQASLEIDKNPAVNQLASIVVNCTEPMRYINYYVFGRGDVLHANTIRTDNRKVNISNILYILLIINLNIFLGIQVPICSHFCLSTNSPSVSKLCTR